MGKGLEIEETEQINQLQLRFQHKVILEVPHHLELIIQIVAPAAEAEQDLLDLLVQEQPVVLEDREQHLLFLEHV